MPKTLLMLKGLPASGKSTFAKKTIEEPGYDKLEIKEIEKLIKNFADKSTKLKGLLNSHKNLKF